MIIEIPGQRILDIQSIVFDFNGTLATDGTVPEDVSHLICELSIRFNLYVLTADTYGTVTKACEKLPLTVKTFLNESAGDFKANFVRSLNSETCACIGNGFNDLKMFDVAALSIAVIGEEGTCIKALSHADIVVKDIRHAINLLLKPNRIVADLRN